MKQKKEKEYFIWIIGDIYKGDKKMGTKKEKKFFIRLMAINMKIIEKMEFKKKRNHLFK